MNTFWVFDVRFTGKNDHQLLGVLAHAQELTIVSLRDKRQMRESGVEAKNNILFNIRK